MRNNTAKLAAGMARRAITRYNNRFDPAAYNAATKGRSTRWANALISEALAICGHPHYRLSRRRWGKAALAFLALFA